MSASKYFWLLNLSVISAIAYISADFTGFVVQTKLESASPEVSKTIGVKRRAELKPSLGFYSVISDKNIFRERSEESLKKPEVAAAPGFNGKNSGLPVINEEPPPVSSLNMMLVGTSVKGGRGYVAILEDRSTRVQKGYHIGDELLPDVTLVDITRKSVTVSRNQKLEVIYYPEIEKKGSASRKRRAAGKGGRGRGDRSVTDITGTRKILDRRYVDNELKDMGRLLTQIRAVPVGKKGFKVFNIVKGSIFEKIGLKNGDMLKRINGLDMSSPDKAMQMYMQLKGATELQLDIERSGSMLSYAYTIR